MTEPAVRIERRGAAEVWTIDRAATRNAVDAEVHQGLALAIDSLGAGTRGVVLRGAHGTFISGGDLKLIAREPFADTLAFCEQMAALLDRVAALPVPVVAAIEGYAYGGGAEIAVACDLRVAASSAKLSFRQAAMGLTTGWGATARLARLVPRGVATRLLLSAEVVTAPRALEVGLVDEVVDGDPLESALAFIERVAKLSPAAVAGFKQVIEGAYGGAPCERERFAELWGGPDHEAALAAYFGDSG